MSTIQFQSWSPSLSAYRHRASPETWMLFPHNFPIEIPLLADCNFGSKQDSSPKSDIPIYMHTAHATFFGAIWCTISIGETKMRKPTTTAEKLLLLLHLNSTIFAFEKQRTYARIMQRARLFRSRKFRTFLGGCGLANEPSASSMRLQFSTNELRLHAILNASTTWSLARSVIKATRLL